MKHIDADVTSAPPGIALGTGFVLLVLAWLVPNHYRPWTSFYGEVLAASGGVLLCVMPLFGRVTTSVPRLSLLFVGMAVVPVCQWMFGLVPYRGDAALATTYIIGAGLLIWAGSELQSRGAPLAEYLSLAAISGSIISIGLGLYQWFGLTGLTIWAVEAQSGDRAIANLAQPNHLGTLICLGIASLRYLYLRARIRASIAILSAFFLLLGLAFSQSRTPWLIAVAILLLQWRRGVDSHLVGRPAALLVISLSIWYITCFLCVIQARDWLHFLDPLHPSSARLAVGTRPIIWKQMVGALGIAPLVGWGWLQIGTAQTHVVVAHPGFEYASYAHNIFLDLALWNGIPLALLSIFYLAKEYRKRIAFPVDSPQQVLYLEMIVIITAHALVEYPHAYTYFLVPLCLSLGAAQGGECVTVPRLSVAMTTFVVAALISFIARDYWEIEREGWRLRMELAHIGAPDAVNDAPHVVFLDQMAAMINGARISMKRAPSQSDLHELQRVSSRFPDQFFLLQYPFSLARAGQIDQAKAELFRFRATFGEEAFQVVMEALRRDSGQYGEGAALLYRELAPGDKPAPNSNTGNDHPLPVRM